MTSRWRWLLGLSVLLAAPLARAVNPAWPNAAATRAELALPANWPDDPGYGYLSKTTCPSGPLAGQPVFRPQAGQWNLWGFYPPDTTDPCADPSVKPYVLSETLLPSERASMKGTGLSADVAWTMTTGDPRVLIAVHDSGALWDDPDLVNKWYLNRGELPLPKHADGSDCAAYDCNGDGVFNVLDYTSGRGHDQPTMATVTDPRITGYPCPGNASCHGDTNGNGLLDPEDLIRIFSNGLDDDGDGFVDDICGWDFFKGGNDPYDDIQFGHGTGEAEESTAEGNNGIGGLGVCPDCRVLPVRVGDSFIADADHFAEGVFFALSQGANVIQEALGTLDNTPLMQRAIDAAYARGAVVVASAADEDSLHHNYPGNAEHTLLVHAITHDQDPEDATSFVRYNNCTNAGAHLVLSTPGARCSSEATGKSAGQAGLIYAAMLKYQPDAAPLSAAEVMQLLWMTSEDIDVPGSANDPTLYPSGPGWDTYFGYGRNDAAASVRAVRAGAIPPEVDVTAPRWFETIDPTTSLAIVGRVAAGRASSYDFEVRVAPGLQPAPSDFQLAATVTGATAPTEGTLATFDVTHLFANPAAVSTDPNAFAATVVVRAVAHYGGSVGDVPGLFRKGFFVHKDPDLFAGFPIYLGTSGESSPHLVDLDGSGHDSVLLATADGRVHAFQADGGELPGWPVQVRPLTDVTANPSFPSFGPAGPTQGTGQAITAAVAVGSLHGDGKLQVVAATLDGQLYAWNADGSLAPGFPVQAAPAHFKDGTHDTVLPDGTHDTYVLGKGFYASPTLVDLAGDGRLEILQPGEDGWLYAWDEAGQPWPGFPLEVRDPKGGPSSNGNYQETVHARLVATATVGDLFGDGKTEIVLGSNETYGSRDGRAYAIWSDGSNHLGGPFLPGWPIDIQGLRNDFLPDIGVGVPAMAAMADLGGDGKDEVEINGLAAAPQFFDGTGQLIGSCDNGSYGVEADSQDVPDLVLINHGSFGDVDGDGKVDFVDGTLGFASLLAVASGPIRATVDHQVMAWSAAKAYQAGGVGFAAPPLPGFPALTSDFQFFMNYAIADVGGDGKNEILSGNGVYLVTAFRADGSEPSGWPKNSGGWVAATPAVGDLDGDGYLDVVTVTREGWLFAWHGKGRADQKIEWESYHHDPRNSGNYGTALAVRHGPVAAPAPKGGCHCGSTGLESWLGLFAGLALLGRNRSRPLGRSSTKPALPVLTVQ